MFLGIDIGTSSVKAALLDDQGAVVANGSAPLTVSRPQPLFSEQNPASWWRATVEAVNQLPAEMRGQVASLGLSGQMHGATLLDREDRVLRPAILWNDGRSAAECAALEEREPRAREITGNIVMPGFTAPKLLWVARHEPEIFARITTVLLPKDYVRLKLTGERATDMSDASGTSWLDVGARQWSDAMLTATGLSRAQMPRLAEGSEPTGTLLAEAADELRLPRQTVVAGGAGDNAASAVGMGITSAGQAFLSLGTSGVLFVATDRFRPNPAKAAHAFCHCLPERWHQMSVMLSAASALDWVASLVRGPDVQTLLKRAQERGLRRTTPFFLPYLSGERTPHNDPSSRGVFFGMGPETVVEDLVLAVLEGVALAFADGLDVLLENDGHVGQICLTGGGARFPFWADLLAAALNRPLHYREGSELAAAVGAARLGRLALTGELPESVCTVPPLVRIISPQAELACLLAERRGLFQRLYRDLKNCFAEFSS